MRSAELRENKGRRVDRTSGGSRRKRIIHDSFNGMMYRMRGECNENCPDVKFALKQVHTVKYRI